MFLFFFSSNLYTEFKRVLFFSVPMAKFHLLSYMVQYRMSYDSLR